MLPIPVWDKDSRPFWKMFPLPSNLNLRRHSFLFICFILVIIGYLHPAETECSWRKLGLPVATKDGFSMFCCMYVVIVTVVLLIWRLHFSWHTYNGSLNWVKVLLHHFYCLSSFRSHSNASWSTQIPCNFFGLLETFFRQQFNECDEKLFVSRNVYNRVDCRNQLH